MSHTKRLNAPRTWNISRKSHKYIITGKPSGHARELSVPLAVVMRDTLSHVQTLRELRIILAQGDIQVDGKVVKDEHTTVGLFDVISIPKLKKYYRIVLDDNGRITTLEITQKESLQKILHIKKKVMLKGNKIQLTFHDGKTLITQDKDIKVGQSLLVDLPKISVVEKIDPKKGQQIYLINGKHSGTRCKLEEFSGDKIVVSTKERKLETLKNYALAITDKLKV